MLGSDIPTSTVDSGGDKADGKPSFADLARTIGAKWKSLPDEEKKCLGEQAAKNKKRYAVELTAWKEQKEKKFDSNSNDGALFIQESFLKMRKVLGTLKVVHFRLYRMMTEGVNESNR